MAAARRMKAIYKGRCCNCNKTIHKGEWIWFLRGQKARCESCGPHGGAQPEPKPKPKPEPKPEPKPKPNPYGYGTPPKPRSGDSIPASDSNVTPDGDATPGDLPEPEVGSDGVWRYQYESIGELMDIALGNQAKNKHNADFLNERIRYGLSGEDSWTESITREQFMKGMTDPPKDTIDKIMALREHIAEDLHLPASPRRKMVRGRDWGDNIDPDRFLAKDPFLWERIERLNIGKPTVMIGVNVAISGFYGRDDLVYRGAAVLALADVLVGRGCNVGITVFDACTNVTDKVRKSLASVVIKSPLMPLDIGSMAALVCEIAYPRLGLFTGFPRLLPGHVDGGLGCPVTLYERDRNDYDYVADSDDCYSEEQAIQWIKESVNKQFSTVPAEGAA